MPRGLAVRARVRLTPGGYGCPWSLDCIWLWVSQGQRTDSPPGSWYLSLGWVKGWLSLSRRGLGSGSGGRAGK